MPGWAHSVTALLRSGAGWGSSARNTGRAGYRPRVVGGRLLLRRPTRQRVAALAGLLCLWPLAVVLAPLPAAYATVSTVDTVCEPPDCYVGVGGSPHHAEFLGSGRLLLDASFSGLGISRSAVATCTDCEWLLVSICKGGTGGGCHGIGSCPFGEHRMLVFLRHAGEPDYTQIGSYCVGPGGPVTVGEMAQRLRDVVVEHVPAVHWAYQPAGGALVNLPALFSSGQPRRLDTRRFALVGFQVVLDARPSWLWTWGDGTQTATTEPGGGWPDRSVSHVYSTPGPVSVALTTDWTGWFTVDGMGPFPAGGSPVVQRSGPWVLPVREARAHLVTP